jgi:hypothetical protein
MSNFQTRAIVAYHLCGGSYIHMMCIDARQKSLLPGGIYSPESLFLKGEVVRQRGARAR